MVEIDELPSETTDNKIALKWKEPKSNGKVTTMYTVDRNTENQRCLCERIENSVGERKGVSVCRYCN